MSRKIWPYVKSPVLTSDEHKLRLLIYKMATKHGVHVINIKSRSQKQNIVDARNEFICKAVELGITRQTIGDFINRDNSTVTGLYHKHKHRYL